MSNTKPAKKLTPKGQRAAEAILDATIEAIADRGAHAASLGDMAERAGVDKGVLRYYFTDRDSLVAAAVEHLGARLVADAERALADIVDPDEGFDRGFELLWSTVTKSPRLHGAYLQLTAASIGDPVLRRHVAKVRTRYDRLILDRARAAEAAGFVWQIPPETMTRLVVAALEGLAIDYLQRGRTKHLQAALTAYREWLHSLAIRPSSAPPPKPPPKNAPARRRTATSAS